jgi:peptidoglycan pentaglycine glycine transferase (the first glycine)
MTDLRQTKEYSKYMHSLGWSVEYVNDIQIYLRKILFGKVMKMQRPKSLSKKVIELIELTAKKNKVFQIIIEPTSKADSKLLMANGYKQTHPFVPSKTIQIAVTNSEKKLLEEMSQKTRYNIKIAGRNGIRVTASDNIEAFVEFWNKCAIERKNFPQTKEILSLYNAFKNKTLILFAFKNKVLLSAVLVIIAHKKAYYMYAASSKTGKQLFAPTLLVWEALILAKTAGAEIFDFEGIYDSRFPLPSWRGFTKFKQGFGGKEVEYPGAFTKWRLPI